MKSSRAARSAVFPVYTLARTLARSAALALVCSTLSVPVAAQTSSQSEQTPAGAKPAPTKDAAKPKKPAPAKKKTAKKPATPSQQQPTTAPKQQPATAAATPAPTANAASVEAAQRELEALRATTQSLIQMLVQQGVLTEEKASALMQAARQSAGSLQADAPPPSPPVVAAATAPADPRVIRVPYVPQIVKDEIRNDIRKEVLAQAKAEGWAQPNAIPEWVERIAFEGDIRLRLQENLYQPGNTPAAVYNTLTGSNLNNTTNDETWWRIRARLGVRATLTPELGAKVSIATGNALNPISLNQDFANYFSGYGVQLDNAYVRYQPKDWLIATAGRMPKPFMSSELVWWDDLVMDGATAAFRHSLTNNVQGFLTAGGYLIQNPQSTPTTPDPETKFLLGIQGAMDWNLGDSTRFKFGLGYYQFEHIEGQRNTIDSPNAADWTVPKFTQKGNTLFDINSGTGNAPKYALASQFRELNITASADLLQLKPYVVRLSADYVKNLGFDRDAIFQRTGLRIEGNRDTGYQAQIQFGTAQINALNDWQVFMFYRHQEGDSVVDAFNDPDFHLGGTDAKGYTIGMRYGLGRGAWLRARWMTANEIDGPPLGIDVFQLDFNAKF